MGKRLDAEHHDLVMKHKSKFLGNLHVTGRYFYICCKVKIKVIIQQALFDRSMS